MNLKPIDLKCQEVVELVNEYLGHRLTPEHHAAFEAHLATCPACSTYLTQIKTVLSTAASLGNASGPVEVEGQLLALFEDWQKRRLR
jgi:anti-sigma factor RsiW